MELPTSRVRAMARTKSARTRSAFTIVLPDAKSPTRTTGADPSGRGRVTPRKSPLLISNAWCRTPPSAVDFATLRRPYPESGHERAQWRRRTGERTDEDLRWAAGGRCDRPPGRTGRVLRHSRAERG